MNGKELAEKLPEYERYLSAAERSKNTITAYLTDVKQFLAFTGKDELTKETVIQYKQELNNTAAKSTVNRKLLAVNGFLKFAGLADLTVKGIKQQVELSLDNVMTVSDLERMFRFADRLNKPTAYAVMQVLAGTGIRIGELRFLTVEALKAGVMTVENKGTVRNVPLRAIKKPLLEYCKANNITSGMVFATRNGTPISNVQISRQLKYIAGQARVKKDKIHPHSFRHLFSINYLDEGGQLTELRDILGHKSLDTTSIYTRVSDKVKGEKMEKASLLKKVKKR